MNGTLLDFRQIVSSDGEKYNTLSCSESLREFHCGNRKNRFLFVVAYSGDGQVLSSENGKNPNWKLITPKSMDEKLFQILCK
ncbi:MAG: surface-adhesin E family protein [bacterium]